MTHGEEVHLGREPTIAREGVGRDRWIERPSSAALILSVVAAIMMVLTWRRWADPVVDFGRELYVPWRLSEGARLYRDIAYFNGPLSPWVNATVFRLFGVSFMILVTFNVLVLTGATATLWALVRRSTDGVTALVASGVFLTVSGFGQGGASANYNFVAPYSHEATHGFALGLLGLLLVCLWLDRRHNWMVFAAGVCAGLAVLTKPEMGLAALVATCLPLLAGQRWGGSAMRPAGAYVAGVALPIVVAVGLLGTYLPIHEAARHALGGWSMAFDRSVTSLPFYRTGAGLDAPLANAARMMLCGAAYATVIALVLLVGRTPLMRGLDTWPRSMAVGIAAFDLSYVVFTLTPLDSARGLPLVAAGGVVVALVRLRRNRRASFADGALLGLSGMASILLLKMLLHARLNGYGFVLAAPALVLAVSGFLAPAFRTHNRGTPGSRTRLAICLGLVLGLPGATVSTAGHARGAQPYVIGRGGDAMRVDTLQGPVLRTVAGALGRLPAGTTLAVLPEGITLNYLNRLVNPTPFISFMPPEVLHFHEDNMIRAFAASPPAYILFLQKSTAEYGLPVFGKDYGRDLVAWIEESYHPVLQAGGCPLERGSAFGAVLLERSLPDARSRDVVLSPASAGIPSRTGAGVARCLRSPSEPPGTARPYGRSTRASSRASRGASGRGAG